MLKAAFFDLFETLITELDPGKQPRPSVADTLGIDEVSFRAEWDRRTEARMSGVIPDYPSVLRAICRALQHPVSEALIEDLHQKRLNDKATPFASVGSDIASALKEIRQNGLQIGVISNCSPEEVVAWDSCPLASLVDTAIFSCDVGCIKPQKEIYWLACARLKVEPADCLFFGDGGSDELMGAEEAGICPYWATWFLDRWPHMKRAHQLQKRSQPYPRLSSLRDLEKAVRYAMALRDDS